MDYWYNEGRGNEEEAKWEQQNWNIRLDLLFQVIDNTLIFRKCFIQEESNNENLRIIF